MCSPSRPVVKLTFGPETGEQVMHIFLDNVKEAIFLHQNDAQRLEELRHEFMECLAIVQKFQNQITFKRLNDGQLPPKRDAL